MKRVDSLLQCMVLILFIVICIPVIAFAETGGKDDAFLHTVLADGFNWGNRPEDLGGAWKTQRYPVDAKIDKWEYVYDSSATYVFNPDFIQLFSGSNRIDTEFSFIHDAFHSVYVKVGIRDMSGAEACKTYLTRKLGQPTLGKGSLLWEKELYAISIMVMKPDPFTPSPSVVINIYVKPSAENRKKSQEATENATKLFKKKP